MVEGRRVVERRKGGRMEVWREVKEEGREKVCFYLNIYSCLCLKKICLRVLNFNVNIDK